MLLRSKGLMQCSPVFKDLDTHSSVRKMLLLQFCSNYGPVAFLILPETHTIENQTH